MSGLKDIVIIIPALDPEENLTATPLLRSAVREAGLLP